MNPYFKETVETKEISGPEKSKLSTAFENEKKSDVRSVQTVEPNINAELEGKKYPGTNVEYKRVRVQVDGVKKEGVFPQFEAKDVERLPKNMYQASDAQQFSHCTKNWPKSWRVTRHWKEDLHLVNWSRSGMVHHEFPG